jgi:uncharacterized protein
MRKRLPALALATGALLALAACVTINVYFPEAAIKDLSRQIEEEVQKRAAEQQLEQQGEPEKPVDPAPPGRMSLLDQLLGVSPAYAQVAAPAVTSPAIRKIIESRAARVEALNQFKAAGSVGENNQALLEVRNLEAAGDLKARAELQRLVRAENADREEMFKEMAASEGVELSQLPRIRETYAGTLRDQARKGDWIQMPDGSWRQK